MWRGKCAAKNVAQAALKDFIGIGVGIVQHTPAVTNDAKQALRIPLRNTVPSPIPAPITFPPVDATIIGPRMTLIKVSDSATRSLRQACGYAPQRSRGMNASSVARAPPLRVWRTGADSE